MNSEAFILRHQPYNPVEGYALELQWEKPLLAIAETEPGPLPDPLIFEGDLTALEGNDYPSNSFHWPIMSRRMLDTLLSVGPFPHHAIPVGVQDKQTRQVNTEKYVAVQLTKHLDLFDAEASKYYYLGGDWSVWFDSVSNKKVLSEIKLKSVDYFYPLFRLSGYPWLILLSEVASAILERQAIKGISFQELSTPRHLKQSIHNDEPRGRLYAIMEDEEISPNDLHSFAEDYNWDGGDEIPLQIIRSPNCSKGTALMLYWLTEPDCYYSMLLTDKEFKQDDVFVFELIKEIERRYSNGFYHYNNIYFDPKNDGGYDWTYGSLFTNIAQNQKIPDIMYKATGPH